MAKVSILIPVYNPRQEYLRECLDSVFNQTYKDFEVVVIDDGSTISVADTLSLYRDKIIYLRQDNGGANSARRYGLQKANGQYVALIDSDDKWLPQKLQIQMEFLAAYPELDLVFSDFQNFDVHGFRKRTYFDKNRIIRNVPYKIAEKFDKKYKILEGNILHYYLAGNFISQCTLVARMRVCRELSMFDTKYRVREFYEFATKSLHHLQIGFIDEVLLHRRIHGSNLTSDMRLHHEDTIRICQDALGYAWMDNQCQQVLQQEITSAQVKLGQYHFVKGDFKNARENWRPVFDKSFYVGIRLLYALTYILPLALFSAGKRFKQILIK